jgi:hypothetical protein
LFSSDTEVQGHILFSHGSRIVKELQFRAACCSPFLNHCHPSWQTIAETLPGNWFYTCGLHGLMVIFEGNKSILVNRVFFTPSHYEADNFLNGYKNFASPNSPGSALIPCTPYKILPQYKSTLHAYTFFKKGKPCHGVQSFRKKSFVFK